mmetsp:Transcript_14732/g.22854  ORF Transcript_14732/g.22854 Transcript_14732/m.22854 type:complete len:99 (+) Transcript_14732:689-985(+)
MSVFEHNHRHCHNPSVKKQLFIEATNNAALHFCFEQASQALINISLSEIYRVSSIKISTSLFVIYSIGQSSLDSLKTAKYMRPYNMEMCNSWINADIQ